MTGLSTRAGDSVQIAAEQVYLFRHALLRDAAYQLQLPGDRARLHGLAFEVIEGLGGGRPPEPAALDAVDAPPFLPHAADVFALELAEHTRLALAGAEAEGRTERTRALLPAHVLYLRRAAEDSERRFQWEAALQLWQ